MSKRATRLRKLKEALEGLVLASDKIIQLPLEDIRWVQKKIKQIKPGTDKDLNKVTKKKMDQMFTTLALLGSEKPVDNLDLPEDHPDYLPF